MADDPTDPAHDLFPERPPDRLPDLEPDALPAHPWAEEARTGAGQREDSVDADDADLDRILSRWGFLEAPPAAPSPDPASGASPDLTASGNDAHGPTAGTSTASLVDGASTAFSRHDEVDTRRTPFRVPRPVVPPSRGRSTRASARDSGRVTNRETAGEEKRRQHPRRGSRTARVAPRGPARSLRRVVVGVLLSASLVMAAGAIASARGGTPRQSATDPLPGSTSPGSSSPGAPLDCRTVTNRTRVPVDSPEPPLVRSDDAWLSVLQALDRARVATLAAGGLAEIDAFDAVGGPAARADAATLCRLRAARLRPVGWRTGLVHVHALSLSTTRVVLDVVDTRSAYALVRDPESAESGATATGTADSSPIEVDRRTAAPVRASMVVARRPARGPLHWLVTLTWSGTSWVIDDTVQVT